MNGTCTSIQCLNDDCLFHIFKIMEICHRLDLESVCQRWKRIIAPLWKLTHKFDVTGREFGYKYQQSDKKRDVNVEICREIISRCYPYLTEINLSRSSGQFERASVINSGHDCEIDAYAIPSWQRKIHDALAGVETFLSQCENIERLFLCSCVLDVTDKFFEKFFENNRKLRSIVLSNYRLSGKTLSLLPLGTLESIELYHCIIVDNKNYESSFASESPNLHTLSVVNLLNCCDFAHKVLPVSTSKLVRLHLINDDITRKLSSNICDLKNLTYLNLRKSILDDSLLALIIDNCKKLIVLDISFIFALSNASLRKTNSLRHLECLNVGFSDNFTDAGFVNLSENLLVLDVSGSDISIDAILMILNRMQKLKRLDLNFLEHLNMSFVESAIEIVSRRSNNIPLEVYLIDVPIDIEEIRNTCPLIEFKDNSVRLGFHHYIK
ncbi:hypothetical protein QAD02_004491 [Eretmocerus hayati]|uniref:Uncharacterized protein n=1 Tax=Eretmocerus hayati TaxID=131215 RepID=A0ACC2NQ66_9HYME|nr:hypothetical protein QAD02_004491 [Eretmocerus hayati]